MIRNSINMGNKSKTTPEKNGLYCKMKSQSTEECTKETRRNTTQKLDNTKSHQPQPKPKNYRQVLPELQHVKSQHNRLDQSTQTTTHRTKSKQHPKPTRSI